MNTQRTNSRVAEQPKLATADTSNRRGKWLRRLLALTVISVGVLPAMHVMAPLQTRWLMAAGMKQVYWILDEVPNTERLAGARPGLPPEVISRKLAKQRTGEWTVRIEPDSPVDLRGFAHEDVTHASVVKFRSATADLVPEVFDVFEVAQRVRRMTEHRTDFHGHDIWKCLAAARDGRGLWCHHFCRIFASVCSSRGYTTRIVSLSCNGNHFDHAMCEIFLPARGGWVLIDVDFGVAYRAQGRWLTAVDLQEIWKTVRDDVASENRFEDHPDCSAKRRAHIIARHNLEVVEFGNKESHLREARFVVSSTGLNLELFEYVFLAVRDDYLSHDYPFAHPIRIGQVCFRADDSDELIEVCPEAHHLPKESVYAAVGRTIVRVEEVGPKCLLRMCFATGMPNFQSFHVRENKLVWRPALRAMGDDWTLTEAANRLEIRAINFEGVAGPSTSIRIEHRPETGQAEEAMEALSM